MSNAEFTTEEKQFGDCATTILPLYCRGDQCSDTYTDSAFHHPLQLCSVKGQCSRESMCSETQDSLV